MRALWPRSSCAVRLGWMSRRSSVDAVPEVEAAKLALSLAERNYRRGESLKTKNAIAASDADQMETDYHSAVHRYHLAVFVAKQLYQSYRPGDSASGRAAKSGGGLHDPRAFDGWVASRDIAVGERVIAVFPARSW